MFCFIQSYVGWTCASMQHILVAMLDTSEDPALQMPKWDSRMVIISNTAASLLQFLIPDQTLSSREFIEVFSSRNKEHPEW